MKSPLEVGVIIPGLAISEDKLIAEFGLSKWETMKKHLETMEVKGFKFGRERWYATTLIIKAIERLCLAEIGGMADEA